jgi:hypothetical protein
VHLGGGATPGGYIQYSLYGPNDSSCTGTPIFTTETEVADNGDYLSQSFVPEVSGTYRWVASYSGDSDNAPAGPGACGEPAETVQVVLPAEPTISSSASGAVTLGGAVRDTAHLENGATPSGVISFQLYPPTDPECSQAPVFTSIVPVSGNGDYSSGAFTTSESGAYRWAVEFSGDRHNTSAGPTECGETAEVVDVRAPGAIAHAPRLSTSAGASSSPLGTPIYDVAHLSGGSSPAGSVSFALHGPDDPSCTKPPAFTSQIRVGGAGDYPSAPFVVFKPGSYQWVASYSGDFANAPVGSGACGEGAEAVTVSSTPSPNPNVPLFAATKAFKRRHRASVPRFTG